MRCSFPITLVICIILGGSIISIISTNSQAELSQTNNTLNLSCQSETNCLLDNSESGIDMISKQENSASPLSPKTVKIEFIMIPEQIHLALLPIAIDELVIDLRIQEDNTGINSPDLTVEFWAGPSTNTWTLEGGSPSSPKMGDYKIEDAELDLSRGRLLRPGEGVGLSITFEINQPVTWELYLKGNSRLIIPIDWSVNILAENTDEPSSASNPVIVSDVEKITRGALLDADQDCFSFEIPDYIHTMTIIVQWSSVPIEIEQPHSPPELIRNGGNTPKNPAIKSTYEASQQITEIQYDKPMEGTYLACWNGQNNHFQSYSWFAKLSLEGLGSSSPTEFSGDANWLSGEAYVGNKDEVVSVVGSNILTLLVGIIGTSVAFAGFAVPTKTHWPKRYVLPTALFILIIGGIASPVWGLTDEAPVQGEITLDELLDVRMKATYDAGLSESDASAASGFFGLSSDDTISLRLHVSEAHPTGDGRWQIHAEELNDIRIDSYVFGWLSNHQMNTEDEIRFILQAGRAITLDLLMLEALLVVDEKPEGELLHIQWDLIATEPAGSVTDPIWSSRPDSITAKEWDTIQSDLFPQLLTISYCDCGMDGMEVNWRPSDNFDANSIPEISGISIASGFLSNEHLWLASGIGLIIFAGGVEYYNTKNDEEK